MTAALQTVPGLPHRPLAAPQFADVAEHGPHGRGAAVGVQDGLAGHVHRTDAAVGPDDPELPVDRLPVDQAVGHQALEHGLVLGEHHGGHLVQRHGAALARASEDLEQFFGPTDLVGQQVPLALPTRESSEPVRGGAISPYAVPGSVASAVSGAASAIGSGATSSGAPARS